MFLFLTNNQKGYIDGNVRMVAKITNRNRVHQRQRGSGEKRQRFDNTISLIDFCRSSSNC